MAVTGTPISGTDGRVTYSGQALNLDKWTVTPQVGDVHTTNFESGGFEEGIVGVGVAEVDFEGFYDAGLAPYAIVGLTPGVLTGGLKLFVSRTLNRFFSFPRFRLLSAPVTNEVDNKVVRISFKGRSDGPWFYPL